MTITLDLPPDLEAKLREGAARQDAETVRRLLAEAVAPTVEALLRNTSHGVVRRTDGMTDAEFEALADELVNRTPDLPNEFC